MTAGGAEKYQ